MPTRSVATPQRILVVDDSADTLEVIQRNLSAAGYRVLTAGGVAEAIALLEETPVELVVTDLKMPRASGLDLVRHVRENLRGVEVMTITGYPSIEGAVEAVKTGAEEYLSKPFTADDLLAAVRRALDKLRLRRYAHGPGRTDIAEGQGAYGLIGQSPPMRQVFDAIGKAAATDATVLIVGESGTGKELVARAIHYAGARAAAPFVPVNCGGIPEGLQESELFGHVKGAFTGASETRAGFFHAADGGAIFLDEVSETSLSMQVKLLRALQDREVCMVGSSRPRKVNVRILAATNKDLAEQVRQGAFRQDLFYRLDVLTIAIPPLRERGDDILLLAQHFAGRFAKDLGRPAARFSDEALQAMRAYGWPGNVRELENVIQRLVIMTDTGESGGLITAPDLPSLMRFSALRQSSALRPAAGLDRTLAEVEAEHIRNVLASVSGNRTQAARILGIDRKTLLHKLAKAAEKDAPQRD